MLHIKLLGHNQSTCVIQAHALVNEAIKDIVLSHRKIIIMKTFITQFGQNKSYENNVAGDFRSGKSINNGQRSPNVALEYDFQIINISFEK